MKLNPDCIRDVLLYLEENLKISEREFLPVTLATLEEKLTQYSKEDVFYSVSSFLAIHHSPVLFCSSI